MRKLSTKILIVSVWAFSSICLMVLSDLGMEGVSAMTIEQDGGCDTEKNIGTQIDCCVNRDDTQDGVVNLIQIQPPLIAEPVAKQWSYDSHYLKTLSFPLGTLNTSSPPKNLPGIIVKKE